jgi:hypothetical protein
MSFLAGLEVYLGCHFGGEGLSNAESLLNFQPTFPDELFLLNVKSRK